MLRTYSREARRNICFYIRAHFDPSGYDEKLDPEKMSYRDICHYILKTFREEKRVRNYRTELHDFFDWAQGLPSMLDTCYYYNRSAVEDLAKILEMNSEEIDRFRAKARDSRDGESEAEYKLTWLMYREMTANDR